MGGCGGWGGGGGGACGGGGGSTVQLKNHFRTMSCQECVQEHATLCASSLLLLCKTCKAKKAAFISEGGKKTAN